jgi:hypothetical protein
MSAKSTEKKSEKIKEELASVQVFARTGRLPIVSEWEEFLAPGVKPRVHPGVVLHFEDGICTLDPKRHADVIAAFQEWLEEGSDPRIAELGLFVVAKDALTPPFPKWDALKPEACLETVDTLGLDPERCLRYELQKGKDARAKLVKQLEAKVDAPPVEDPMSEPSL